MQENHSDFSGVAQHALVLGSSYLPAKQAVVIQQLFIG